MIVSDVSVPDLSGLYVLAALRCARRETPIVLISEFGDDETRMEARELGVFAFLDKPLDVDVLRTTVMEAPSLR